MGNINFLSKIKWSTVKSGIKNLIYWIPKVWSITPLSNYDIERLMLFQMKQVQSNLKVLQQKGFDFDIEIKSLRICIKILDRRINCYYDEWSFDKCDKITKGKDQLNLSHDDKKNIFSITKQVIKMEERDLCNLLNIYKKYHGQWW